MLKMKMMAFFKNAVVRDIFIVLTAIIIVASILAIPVSNAGSQINVAFRAASMGVSAGTRDIQIPELSPKQSGDKSSKYRNIFCIQEGNNLSYAVYTNEYNGYNSGEVSKYFRNYGSAIWLIDNMYIADSTNSSVGLDYLAELVTSPEVARANSQFGNVTPESIKALDKTVGGKKDKNGYVMNKNFIEVIEQLVLWNYTNNKSGINPDSLVSGGFSGNNITSADQNAAKYLYFSLKYLADKNSSYSSNGTVSNAVSFDTTKATIDTATSKVGPYALRLNGVALNIDSALKSKISATVVTSDGASKTLDSSKVVVDNDGAFYIDISGCGQISKVNVNIDSMYTGCTTSLDVIVNGKNQNIINIRKTYNSKPFSDEKTISYAGKYTLRLVKTKIDGTTVIAENPAVFTISGAVDKKGAQTEKDGKLVIADSKEITDASATDTYTIVEDTAPKGYVKYDGTITLNVGFKVDGTKYLLDKDKISFTANGQNGTVRVFMQDASTIEIFVPNKEEERRTPKFDLSLRKFITKIDGKTVEVSRVPVIDKESKDVLDLTGTAVYHHTKKALNVKAGSEVEYTIRVYNEGEVDGVAKEITDYLPAGLSFVKVADESARLYSTDSKVGSKEVVLKYNGTDIIGADSIGRILNNDTKNAYQEVKLICKVNEGATGYITNRAEITVYGYTDTEGKWHEAKAIGDCDRDSVEKTISGSLGLDKWYENAKTYTYVVNGASKDVKDYYPGVQDDDDFETVVVEKKVGNFDLSLRKFITNIDGKDVTTRIPQVTLTDDFKSGKVTTAKYDHPKNPMEVETDNVVTYTIRVYNEGDIDGYATKIMDDIPEGLEFLPENETNKANKWKMYEVVSEKYHVDTKGFETITYNNKTYVATNDATKADLIVTDALKDQLLKAYKADTSKELDYKDVKVAFKVVEPNSSDRIIINYAQISEHKDKEGKVTVTDRDSTPNVWNEGEDDQDIEKIKLVDKTFDLSLRKFITNVNGKEVTTRIPQVTLTDDFKSGKVTTATYDHPKDPVDVVQGNVVTYTIRVYNEGAVDGYATKIMDDIPEGLEFLPEDGTNKANGWKMYQLVSEKYHYDTKGYETITYNKNTYVRTNDATKADLIVTDALQNQLIKAYDAKTMQALDYKDVKVAFKVVEPNTSDRIIINYAQISEHKDKYGRVTVIDRDSTPNVWNEGEDDQDIEKIRLRYFDLALRKWVTEAIITENGQTQVIPTGHHAEDDPEAIVKVDLKKSKLSNVTVKFRYSIRVTNEGEIAGYAKEITDYIPDGLKFVAEDNTGWTTTEDPNIVKTDYLANTLLNPGESAEVTIVLRWMNNVDNLGVKINTAEISKDYNEYQAKDIDSTPNNRVPKEDDIDDAPVMLSVKTGSAVIGYVTLAVVFFAIIGAGVYTIKRRII